MARRLPPLKALRIFEAAARHGNFTAAADELSLTHSAVSQQIRLLEDYIGQALFARESRGASLLPHAQAYFAEVQASLERIEAATARLRSPVQRQSLRIYSTPSLAMKWLIPRLAGFQDRVPDIDVQLTTLSRQFIDHADSTGDVLIRRVPMQRQLYTCLQCAEDYTLPVASPRFIARSHLEAPSDCLGLPLLQAASSMENWPRWFKLAGVPVPDKLPGPVFDYQFLCLQAAMNDLGIALAPWCLVEDDIKAGRLRPVFQNLRLPSPGIFGLYRTDSPTAELAKQFIDWLSQKHFE